MVDIGFNIKSVFDRSGVKEARSALDQLKGSSDEMDISASELNRRMQALDISFKEGANAFQDGKGDFMDTSNAVNALSGEFAALAAASMQSGRDMDIIQNQLDASNMAFKKTEKGVSRFRDEFTGKMFDSQEAVVQLSNQVGGFNEEALSALFATMAVARQMDQLLQPSLEAAGVFDLFSNTLKLFFLPIAFQVRDIVLKLREFLLNIPSPVRKVIGAFIIAIAIIAKIGTVIAGLMVNLGTLKTLFFALKGAVLFIFGGIKSGIATAIGAIVSFFGPVFLVVAAIVGVIAGLWVAWQNNFLNIRQVTGKVIKKIVDAIEFMLTEINLVTKAIDGIIEAFNNITGNDVDTVSDKISDLADNVRDFGDSLIESGEKYDELNDKTAEDAKEGFKDKFVPDVGGSKTSAKGSSDQAPKQEKNNYKNKFNIETKKGQDERSIAEEINRLQKQTKDNKTREP